MLICLNDENVWPKVNEWYQTSQYQLLNIDFYWPRLGVFQYVKDILQLTVLLDHPVKNSMMWHYLDRVPLVGAVMWVWCKAVCQCVSVAVWQCVSMSV